MSLKARLATLAELVDKSRRLENTHSPTKQPCTGARELLQVRFERADPETVRLLAAISKRIERAAEN